MRRTSFMVVAGEPSGDLLGAELVRSLREQMAGGPAIVTDDHQPLQASLAPEFFGAGGPNLAEAGVQLAFDLTQHAVVGLFEVIRHYATFRRLFWQLVSVAKTRLPDVIVCIDFSGFNLRFATAVQRYTRSERGTFANWDPLLVQYVSPQVWASRPERARRLARDFDLLLSILPFEKDWYQARLPKFPVVFVGHPVVDRYAGLNSDFGAKSSKVPGHCPKLLLLPGSRTAELRRHLPVMMPAYAQIRMAFPQVQARMILPTQELAELARAFSLPAEISVEAGKVDTALDWADLAMASTGTVTLECACFGVPTVALYRTSDATYWIGKQLVQVPHLAMPNLLAGDEVVPEFIQHRATAANLAKAVLDLLREPQRYQAVRLKLREIAIGLGPPGASTRAAAAILHHLKPDHIRASLRS